MPSWAHRSDHLISRPSSAGFSGTDGVCAVMGAIPRQASPEPHDEPVAQDPSTPESPSPAADAGAEALSRALAELGARAGEADVHADLGRERALMEVLGDPQDAAPVAHLAGTNGKTSTARMVDALVRAAGLTTGLYTSPHLHSPAERIAVNGTAISGERFAELYAEVAPYAALVDAAAARSPGSSSSRGWPSPLSPTRRWMPWWWRPAWAGAGMPPTW